MSAITDNMATPMNLSTQTPDGSDNASVRQHNNNELQGAEALNDNESTAEPPPILHNEEHPIPSVECVLEELPLKPEIKEEETPDVGVNEECREDSNLTECAAWDRQIDDPSRVGKLKIKPMASLVETKPNPRPGIHPFFAGFEDHIRSLIMNQNPQFAMPLVHTPGRFMYYDNSTNMSLKKILNGHKMAHIPFSRPTVRPYVPINVPRPPRHHVPLRFSFSTQTPLTFIGVQPNSGAPSTSQQWIPQVQPPVQNFAPQNNMPAQNFALKHLSVPKLTTENRSTNPKTKDHFPTAKYQREQDLPMVNPPVPNDPLQTNKVSTSSSTDDLQNHSSENNVIIKTEVDLDVDSKEYIQANLETHSKDSQSSIMDVTDPAMSTDNTDSKFGIIDATPQAPLLTGDTVTPETSKRPAFELPVYSTKGDLLCKCCDFRCNKKKKLKEHFDTMHTAETTFKCFYCIKNQLPSPYNKTVHDLEHHVAKVHRGEKRWQCKNCSKTYKCRSSYRAHKERTCSQSHPYACHKCTFTCLTEAALDKHIKSHEKVNETQQCPFCNKSFKRLYMKQHLITVHAPPEEKPFHCVTCKFAAGNKIALENHYKRSGHNKKFKCNQCDYASCNENHTKSHILIVHKKEIPDKFVCGVDGCQVRCYPFKSLHLHRRIHSIPESDLVVCPDKECSMKFTSEQSLRHHINKTQHHKPFKCPDCTLRFLKEESLNRHIQSIHVTQLLRKMANPPTREQPVQVKNVVDVYNYVESGGLGIPILEPKMGNDDGVTNFGCWLGISGFGDIADKTDCDIQVSEDIDEEVEQSMKIEDNEDEVCQNLVPITCLEELKNDEEDNSNPFFGKATDAETPPKKEEEDEEMNDSEYQYVTPELSCFVECQQNATVDSSTETNFIEDEKETNNLPANHVKIEIDDKNF